MTVTDALVDTGATTLGVPKRFLEQLGLTQQYEKRAVTAAGVVTADVYDAARLDIGGRLATVDPTEAPDGSPVLIGQIPLERMDGVVDLQARRLIGKPAHGGERILELL